MLSNQVRIWGGGATPNFETQFFATTATLLRDVGKISLARLPPTQILDPHLQIWEGGNLEAKWLSLKRETVTNCKVSRSMSISDARQVDNL